MKRGRFWLVMALPLAALACGLSVDGPKAPASPIPVSTESVGELQENWKAAATSVPTGSDVTVTITEQQLTSLVALRLQEQESPPIRDPQVFLRDNKLQLFGTAEAGGVRTTALVVISVTVNPDGTVLFKAEEANFGPLPVPEALLEQVSTTLNEALTGNAGTLATGLKITNIVIADGQMVITARFTR